MVNLRYAFFQCIFPVICCGQRHHAVHGRQPIGSIPPIASIASIALGPPNQRLGHLCPVFAALNDQTIAHLDEKRDEPEEPSLFDHRLRH